MITLYFAYILDYQGAEVLRLAWTTTAKHSAFLAKEYIDSCPPAASFKITKRVVDSRIVVAIMNNGRGYGLSR
jgi:hypothetical protein